MIGAIIRFLILLFLAISLKLSLRYLINPKEVYALIEYRFNPDEPTWKGYLIRRIIALIWLFLLLGMMFYNSF